jgi:hypothetical protein
MNVEEAIAGIAQVPAGAVLVAKPPLTWGAEAKFVVSKEGFVPHSVKQDGFEYVLEHDEIVDLLHSIRRKRMSARSVSEFIIHYAINDSYPAWINDIPDAPDRAAT